MPTSISTAQEPSCSKVSLKYPGKNVAAFYNEVNVIDTDRGTRFVVCGWESGEFGLEHNVDGKRVVFLRFDNSGTNQSDAASGRKITYILPNALPTDSAKSSEYTLNINWKTERTYRFLVVRKPIMEDVETTLYFYHPSHEEWTRLAVLQSEWIKGGMKELESSISGITVDRYSHLNGRSADFGRGFLLDADQTWKRIGAARFSVDNPEFRNFDGGKREGRFYLETGGQYYQGGHEIGSTIRLADRSMRALRSLPEDVDRLVKSIQD